MLVTPAMSAVDVGRFFGDGQRAFSLEPAYAYHNDNGKGYWYYALWVDDYRDIVVGDVAAIPAAFPPGSVHVSLLTAWMPDEATATAFFDAITAKLAGLKAKSSTHFRGTGIFNAELTGAFSDSRYAVVDLKVDTPLYRTCHHLVQLARQEVRLPQKSVRTFKTSFHASFATGTLGRPSSAEAADPAPPTLQPTPAPAGPALPSPRRRDSSPDAQAKPPQQDPPPSGRMLVTPAKPGPSAADADPRITPWHAAAALEKAAPKVAPRQPQKAVPAKAPPVQLRESSGSSTDVPAKPPPVEPRSSTDVPAAAAARGAPAKPPPVESRSTDIKRGAEGEALPKRGRMHVTPAERGRMHVTPAERQPRPRLGGISLGEGGWRLAPLSVEQAYTFFVPFLTKELGQGVWARLQQAARDDNVTIKLRGLASSGRRDSPQEHRSLSAYGVEPEMVERHVKQILDAAVAAGVDPTKFQLPDHWRHILDCPRPKLPVPPLPPSVQPDSDLEEGEIREDEEEGGCLSPPPPPRVVITIVSVGLRFLDGSQEYRDLPWEEQNYVWWVAKEGRYARDPGEDTVASALRKLNVKMETRFGEYAVDECISTMDMYDPAAMTEHCGLAWEVQEQALRTHEARFRRVFRRVKEALRKAMAQHQENVLIAVYCKSGRHRSVATTEILANVLWSIGHRVNEPAHLADYWWRWLPCRRKCRRGSRCLQCTPEVDDRKAALYRKACEEYRAA